MEFVLGWMNINFGVGCLLGFIIGYVIGKLRSRELAKQAKPSPSKSGSNQAVSKGQAQSNTAYEHADRVARQDETNVDTKNTAEVPTAEGDDVKVNIMSPIVEAEVDPDALRDKQFGVEGAPAGDDSASYGTAYLSTPTQEGDFDDSQRYESYRPGASMYQIFYTNEMRTACEYELVTTDDALDLALRRREQVIDLVADMSNAYRDGMRYAITDARGEAELVGEVWKIRRKMKGHYE